MQFNILYEVPLASTVVAQKQKVFTGFTLSKEQQEFMLWITLRISLGLLFSFILYTFVSHCCEGYVRFAFVFVFCFPFDPVSLVCFISWSINMCFFNHFLMISFAPLLALYKPSVIVFVLC